MAIVRIPALIDPHVHLTDSSAASWQKLVFNAARAGYGAIQIMPDLDPPITDSLSLAHYRSLAPGGTVTSHLAITGTAENIESLKQAKQASAVKVWLGTGPEELVVYQEEELRQILLSTDKIVMVHAEDELSLLKNFEAYEEILGLDQHAEIFDRSSAIRATVKAITAAKETGRRIYLCHISTGEEVELIRAAKAKGYRVFAEVAPHHLFLTDSDLSEIGIFGKVNPPLRSFEDQVALWQGINDGTIDTIGSDHHTWSRTEKDTEYEDSPTGLPNLELVLPLLLTAVKDKKLSLAKAIALTSTNPARIFSIPRPTRSLFVDLDNPRIAQTRLSDWQPYGNRPLVGWTIRQLEERLVKP